MAVSGRKPKPRGQAVNRSKPTHEWTEVPDTLFMNAPPLPEVRGNGQEWKERALHKWAVWSTMPHCVLWTESDWQFAIDTLELVSQFYSGKPSTMLATEIRNREKVMGTTVEYRRDLRIRYVDSVADEKPDEPVTRLDDYRDL